MSEATGPAGPHRRFCNKRSGYHYVTSNNRRGRAKRGGGILSPVPHRGSRVAAGVKRGWQLRAAAKPPLQTQKPALKAGFDV